MSDISKIMLFLFILTTPRLQANTDNDGVLKGKLLINCNIWEQTIYISKILDFNDMFSITNEMINTQATIDSLGYFQIDLGFLPKDETLLRIHIVKKGNPPASLIVGSRFENHFFIVADKNSKINIENKNGESIFSKIIVSGSPNTNDFNLITEISRFPDVFDYDDKLLKKDFVQQVANVSLRLIADTCNNQLVSLYALYKSDFEEDFIKNPDFYESYFKKWKQQESPYFNSFSKLVIDNDFPLSIFLVFIVIILLTIGFIFYRYLTSATKLLIKKPTNCVRKTYTVIYQ